MKQRYIIFTIVIIFILAVFAGYIFTSNRLRELTSSDFIENDDTLSEQGQDQESKDRGFEQIKPIKIGDRQYRVAFLGDQGYLDSSKAVMKMLKEHDVDLIVQLGDFDYLDNPIKWRNLFTDQFGEDVPVLAVMGNHEVPKWSSYSGVVRNFIGNATSSFPGMNCAGDLGRDYACKDNMFHFVFTSPKMTNIDHPDFVKKEFENSKSLWRICVWHKNQELMQVGDQKNETGWEVYEECRKAGAMIFTGHDHVYARSYLLSSVINQNIATTSDVLVMKPGVTFVTVSGLGGKSVRGQLRNDPWWASIYTGKQKANPGAVICTFGIGIKDIYTEVKDFDLGKSGCYFRDIKGFVPDAYYLETTFGTK